MLFVCEDVVLVFLCVVVGVMEECCLCGDCVGVIYVVVALVSMWCNVVVCVCVCVRVRDVCVCVVSLDM